MEALLASWENQKYLPYFQIFYNNESKPQISIPITWTAFMKVECQALC